MKRICLLTVGTRGDLEPYLHLAEALREEGAFPRIAAPAMFEAACKERKLDFYPLPWDPRAAMNGEDGQELLNSGGKVVSGFAAMRKFLGEQLESSFAEMLAAAEGFDAVMYGVLALAGPHVAERLGIPSHLACVQPTKDTREFSSPSFSSLPWIGDARGDSRAGAFANRLSWKLSKALVDRTFGASISKGRQSIGLDPGGRPLPKSWLYGYSPLVVPKPADWSDAMHVTGFWRETRPSEPLAGDLAAFIDRAPTISVGFGSMAERGKRIAACVEAAKIAGLQVVLIGGWAGGHSHQDHVFVVDEIPHVDLFPRVQAVVHHGGSGTTCAALHAGVPQVIFPFFGDQHFWGHRVARLGVSPPAIAKKAPSVAAIAAAFTDALSRKPAAKALAERLNLETGAQTAARSALHGH